MTNKPRIKKSDCPHPKWARQAPPGKTTTYCGVCGGNLHGE